MLNSKKTKTNLFNRLKFTSVNNNLLTKRNKKATFSIKNTKKKTILVTCPYLMAKISLTFPENKKNVYLILIKNTKIQNISRIQAIIRLFYANKAPSFFQLKNRVKIKHKIYN